MNEITENKFNGIQKTIGIFFSPIKTIEDIQKKQHIFFGIIVTAILILISSVVSLKVAPIYFEDISQVLIDKYGLGFFKYMSEAQKAVFANTSITTFAITFVISFVAVLFQYAFLSGIVLLVFKIFKGNTNFKIIFSSLMYINIVVTVVGLILMALQYTLKTSLNIFSLAAIFMPNGNFTSLLYNFLSSINISTIWGGLLLSILCFKVENLTKTKAIIIAVIFIIVSISMTAGSLHAPNISYDTTYNSLKSMGIF